MRQVCAACRSGAPDWMCACDEEVFDSDSDGTATSDRQSEERTSAMAVKIKPCPFCGSKAKVGSTFFGLQDMVKCTGCGVMIWQPAPDAIKSWNTRNAS